MTDLRLFGPLLMLLVSGCNVARTDAPLFAPGDRSASLSIEDGLWLRDEPDCRFDSSRPLGEWPRCAGWMIAVGNKVYAAADSPAEQMPQDILIVDGPPPVIQAEFKESGKPPMYFYLGLKPGERGSSGKLRTAQIWIVACGVQASPNSEIDPFPGINPDCIASSKQAIFDASRNNPAKAEDRVDFRWIRPEAPPEPATGTERG